MSARTITLLLICTIFAMPHDVHADWWKIKSNPFKGAEKGIRRVRDEAERGARRVRDAMPKNKTYFHPAPTSSKPALRAAFIRNSTPYRMRINVFQNGAWSERLLRSGERIYVGTQNRHRVNGHIVNYPEFLRVTWDGHLADGWQHRHDVVIGATYPPTPRGYQVSNVPTWAFVANGSSIYLRRM